MGERTDLSTQLKRQDALSPEARLDSLKVVDHIIALLA
jgi:hypothetical protein